MSNKILHEDLSRLTPGARTRNNLVSFNGGALVSKLSDGDGRYWFGATVPGPSPLDPGSVSRTKRGDPCPLGTMPISSPGSMEVDEVPGVWSDPSRRVVGSHLDFSEEVRRRMNAAVRPILEAFARCQGLWSKRLLGAIGGPTPLTHPVIVRELGGALHSEAMRSAITANASFALVPLQVRAGLAKLMAQELATPPSGGAKEAFADWDKPLVPVGHHHPAWHAKDAVAWLKNFPPVRRLPQPLDTWDDATAAVWLNDRVSIATAPQDGEADSVVMAIDASNPWKPPLEVLHTLDELELEELAYRVFVERLRREVMPSYISERRILVWDVILHVTFGYSTLPDARWRVREHDLKRVRHFDRLFGTDREWIHDLVCRIIDAYAWPIGFTEPELWSEFPGLEDFES